MIDLTLQKDELWEKIYTGLIESYVPGRIPPPEKFEWTLALQETVYEIEFSGKGTRTHVIVETRPRFDNGFFIFNLKGTRYATAAHLIESTIRIKPMKLKTYHQLMKSEFDVDPYHFPREEDGKGKVVVKYWRKLEMNENEEENEDENEDQ